MFLLFFGQQRRRHFCLQYLAAAAVSALLLLLFVSIASPQNLESNLISVSYDQSCANIVDNSGKATLQCNNATVLIIELASGSVALDPNATSKPATFQYDFTAAGHSGGGGSGVNNNECALQGPGTCLQGKPFRIVISVTNITMAYSLSVLGTQAPFGYVYGNCLTRKNFGAISPYPDELNDLCGPTTTHNLDDFIQCKDPASFPSITNSNFEDYEYSDCALECSIERGMHRDDIGGLVNYCQQKANMNDLHKEFQTTPKHLACPPLEWTQELGACQPNMPLPNTLCPCANAPQTMINIYDNGGQSTSQGVTTPPNLVQYAPAIVCKSGSCAGTCGSALRLPNGENITLDNSEKTCNITDQKSDCINYNQNHRCLKCQPHMEGGSQKDNECYYMDISRNIQCTAKGSGNKGQTIDFASTCGLGQFVFGGHFDSSWTQVDSLRQRDARMCNCDANFVERAYWAAPICAPYIIQNPPQPHYTVLVEIFDENGVFVVGSNMTVGAGYDIDGETVLSRISTTPDGFALTKVLSLDSSTGTVGEELHGLIVMCNDQSSTGVCGLTSNSTNTSNLPNPKVSVSSPDGRANPWIESFLPGEAKVPLPDMLYRYAGEAQREKDQSAWWYYVSRLKAGDYGIMCGQIGWSNNGYADLQSANTMCSGPQGTCVPGVDTLFRGEAVEPPCSAASSFFRYYSKNGGSLGVQGLNQPTTGCGDFANGNNLGKSPPFFQPRFVPFNWYTAFPQYWVSKGYLWNSADRTVAQTRIRLEIAIAADFVQSEISQTTGRLEYVTQESQEEQESPNDDESVGGLGDCQVQAFIGIGSLRIRVIDTGSINGDYILTGDCSPGIFATQTETTVVVGASPSAPNSGTITTMQLSARGDFQTIDPDSIGVPFCDVSLHPSQDLSITFDTKRVLCSTEVGIPVISPTPIANITFGNSVSEVVNGVAGQACGIFQVGCYIAWNQNFHFTPLQQMLITFFVIILIFGLMLLFMIYAVRTLLGETWYYIYRGQMFQNYINQGQMDQAKIARVKEQTLKSLSEQYGEGDELMEAPE